MHINQEEYKVIHTYIYTCRVWQGEFSRIAAKYNTLLTTLLYFASFCIVSLWQWEMSLAIFRTHMMTFHSTFHSISFCVVSVSLPAPPFPRCNVAACNASKSTNIVSLSRWRREQLRSSVSLSPFFVLPPPALCARQTICEFKRKHLLRHVNKAQCRKWICGFVFFLFWWMPEWSEVKGSECVYIVCYLCICNLNCYFWPTNKSL